MLAPGTVLQDRYRIVRQLGKGGMGTVYEAHHTKLKHTVAVKETFFLEDHLTKAFEREAQLLAGLSHPALPKVSDYFSEGEGYFLVMEFVPGKDLSALLAERGTAFPVEHVLWWADELLDALEYLHSRQPPVIHRDIKPANLKLAANGKIFLLDFGLAKGLHTQMSRVTGPGGASVQAYTPGYAPVEQMQGSGTDARSDIFSLGATLYHLITGAPPVDALTRAMNVGFGDSDPLRPAHVVNLEINPALSMVLHKALALKSEGRPATATEFRRILREATKRKEPVRPVEPSIPSDPVPANPEVMSGEAETVVSTKPFQVPLPEPEAFQTRPMVDQSAQTVADTLQSGRTKAAPAMPAPQPPPMMSPTIPAPPVISPAVPAMNQASPKNQKWLILLVLAALVVGVIVIALNWKSESFKNSIEMEFVLIPAGEFQMGSTQSDDEKPVHKVKISEGFYLGKYEVTQAEWEGVMGNNPSNFKGDRLPVENVSWDECQKFLEKLSAKKDGYTYRLPSEAEWEYACRAGTTGDHAGNLDEMAWYSSNSGSKPHPVGQKKPNEWGLHDMHGNVWEWCQDWYQGSYNGAPTDGRAWELGADKQFRVMRGGSWHGNAGFCRSADRSGLIPEYVGRNYGFRVVAVRAVSN
ncbi:MAG: SUMF1/EgtB/PvdO family nonheme iron enzyme [Acidobacteria bacterium]|nr:SUMF1/EgtB/PvdO family nonheme iron enzyme [Acidobacteriota bacterium]